MCSGYDELSVQVQGFGLRYVGEDGLHDKVLVLGQVDLLTVPPDDRDRSLPGGAVVHKISSYIRMRECPSYLYVQTDEVGKGLREIYFHGLLRVVSDYFELVIEGVFEVLNGQPAGGITGLKVENIVQEIAFEIHESFLDRCVEGDIVEGVFATQERSI